jgi:biopolymer transport protein ExbD
MAVALPPSGETGEDRYAPLAEINVTPMVDVMLVLFVIFMVTAPLLTVGAPLDLPKSRATTLTEPKKPVIISLNRDAEVFIGDERVDADQLEPRLAALAAEDPTRIVYVRSDKSNTYAQGIPGCCGWSVSDESFGALIEELSSHTTRCWREMDSNPRSPV